MKLDYDEELFDNNGNGVLDEFERDDYEKEQMREIREILHSELDDFPIPDAYNSWTDNDDSTNEKESEVPQDFGRKVEIELQRLKSMRLAVTERRRQRISQMIRI